MEFPFKSHKHYSHGHGTVAEGRKAKPEGFSERCQCKFAYFKKYCDRESLSKNGTFSPDYPMASESSLHHLKEPLILFF